jgi:hypothetical protein
MKSRKRLNRRDLCNAIGTRALNLNIREADIAWQFLAEGILVLADPSVPRTPKFRDLIELIRAATIFAKKKRS